jgi:hypothetical protein
MARRALIHLLVAGLLTGNLAATLPLCHLGLAGLGDQTSCCCSVRNLAERPGQSCCCQAGAKHRPNQLPETLSITASRCGCRALPATPIIPTKAPQPNFDSAPWRFVRGLDAMPAAIAHLASCRRDETDESELGTGPPPAIPKSSQRRSTSSGSRLGRSSRWPVP